jgi:hypothetical protein
MRQTESIFLLANFRPEIQATIFARRSFKFCILHCAYEPNPTRSIKSCGNNSRINTDFLSILPATIDAKWRAKMIEEYGPHSRLAVAMRARSRVLRFLPLALEPAPELADGHRS